MMTNQQAAAKARKLYGDASYVRSGERMSSAERREKKLAEYKQAQAEITAIGREIDERLRQLDWHQELRARQRELRKKSDSAQGHAMYYRFSVGKSNGICTTILGQGDTWEEAFAKANGKS